MLYEYHCIVNLHYKQVMSMLIEYQCIINDSEMTTCWRVTDPGRKQRDWNLNGTA